MRNIDCGVIVGIPSFLIRNVKFEFDMKKIQSCSLKTLQYCMNLDQSNFNVNIKYQMRN